MEVSYSTQIMEIEIGLLELRYGHTRIHRPEVVSSLVNSIKRSGQIVPVIALRKDQSCFVLMDGYQRVSALKCCGSDTVLAEVWQCKEQDALVRILASGSNRKWDVIEEAAIIQELHCRYDLSQAKIASVVGRKQGWVSGRLALIEALPEEVLELVRKGQVSAWAAARVIAPIARAIPDHAKILTQHLVKEHISSRELAEFFRHYQKANRAKREKMVKQPVLFIKALRYAEDENEAVSLKAGPEGKWVKDLRVAKHIFRQLLRDVPAVIYKGQSKLDRRTLITAFEDVREIMLSLEQKIKRLNSDDIPRNKTSHSDVASTGSKDSKDKSTTQYLQEHCAQGLAGTDERSALEDVVLRRDQGHDLRSVQAMQG